MEDVVCSLCGKKQASLYLEQTDRFGSQQFTFKRCLNCGLIYLNPRPTMNEISYYYPDVYEAFSEINTATVPEKSHIARSLKKQMGIIEAYTTKPGKLLDVGCAKGNFLIFAKTQGWQVTGIEPHAPSAFVAREKYGLNVLTGTLEPTTFPSCTFDVITLWDVLEHLPNPKTTLRTAKKILRPDGIIVFSIPNLYSFDRFLFRSYWIGWDPPRHFTLFTEKTLTILLDEVGFQLLDSHCITGGKGTFFLNLDLIIQHKPHIGWLKHLYPSINLLLWPYRQISYMLKRGPIITYIAKSR